MASPPVPLVVPAVPRVEPELLVTQLVGRDIDRSRAEELVAGAPPEWLAGPADLVNAEAALAAKPLGDAAIRVRVDMLPVDEPVWRVTVVLGDRPGLLAVTAAVMADHALSVRTATAVSWPTLGVALQRLEVESHRLPLSGEPDWVYLGSELRAALRGEKAVQSSYRATGAATVRITPLTPGRWQVNVECPDGLGLLAAIAAWFTEAGANIEHAEISSVGGVAGDRFVVSAADDFERAADELTRVLSA